MKKILFIIFFTLIIVEISLADIYKWVDDKGGVYFTDDISQVPEKYRLKTEIKGCSEVKEEIDIKSESTDKRKNEIYKDRLGRGEEYWKGQIGGWRQKLKELQDQLESLRAKYNELTERHNDSRSAVSKGNFRRERDKVKNEMDQCKNQIKEARNMIEKKIPEEAELYKAKKEWLKL
jgi:hypothetical protein